MTDVQILAVRPLEARDREGWEPLWQAYLGFYATTVPEAVTDVTFQRLVGGGGDMAGFVAVDTGGRPVGLSHYLLHPSTWSIAPRCYLQDLFVAPHARGGGVGRSLVEAVYDAADAAGAAEVYWLTQDFNVTAIRLYDRIAERTAFVKYRRSAPAIEAED